MSARVDVAGILERAGADANAPEGSQAWALAQASAAIAKLIEAANAVAGPNVGIAPRDSKAHALRAALARVGGGK